MTILPKIDSKYINSTTGVTDTKLPLLLIKNAMKLAKVKIYFDDIINIFGENIGISFTESRHYFIPINHTNKAISEVDKSHPTEHFLLNISNISSKAKKIKNCLEVTLPIWTCKCAEVTKISQTVQY